jgi:predicted nuclease of predicted toxin-antitoxin system
MRLKLDENMPRVAAAILRAHGHEVATVVDESLAGADDPSVAHAAANESRMLVTMDRGFADIRSYPPGQHPGVVLLRLNEQRPPAVSAALAALLRAYDLDTLAGCIVIVQATAIRVRRPDSEC